MAEPQSPRDVAKHFYDSYNEQDIDASFERYVAEDAKNHAMGGRYDRQAWLGVDALLVQAFADFSMTVLDQVAEGDKVATRWMVKGAQRSEFLGIPSSGRTAVLTGTAVDLIRDGKVAEHWLDIDLSGFLQQLAGTES
ncbi:ester cyclase (plasmid) [Streptomyces sp. NBC_01450]|uniref:ester cyclase n=1 Tax=Streptomyces sp. NBC_01450 TaxID=2903871 RepID=UPI002E2F9FF1|nr:ester cyclase [Streptomyces sp. NBC_01450]